MENTDAAKFFDRFAFTFDTFYENKRNPVMQWIDKKFRKDMFIRYAMTFDFLGDLKGSTVVDIGCGSGIYMAQALKAGADFVTGVDPAEGMLQLSAERLSEYSKDKFNLIKSDFPSEAVRKHDYAIVMGVMDYISDPETFISNLQKIVNKSACISFPSEHWFRSPIRKIRYDLRNCPLFFYREEKIKKIGELAEFKKTSATKIQGSGMDFFVVMSNE